MEKTTKKKKSKKGLRKRIGIIAVGGLSLVLTVCLSVGATLAWFAGSTWASESLYMGGPVYIEMAGRGKAGGTNSDGTSSGDAKWIGGNGNLDIKAAAARETGSTESNNIDYDQVLLPGQRVEIYSQARVFSTSTTTSVADDALVNSSSGANTTNTSNGTITYKNNKGRVTTTTTSVLRARFSVDIEFDPAMGYNNFTGTTYRAGYPTQTSKYVGDGAETCTGTATKADSESGAAATIAKTTAWFDALGATFKTENTATGGTTATDKDRIVYTGRRDAVTDAKWIAGQNKTDTDKIRKSEGTSIYKWKYVTKSEYEKAAKIEVAAEGGNVTLKTGETIGANGVRMAAPFDGSGTDSATPYYGIWVTEQVVDKDGKNPGDDGYIVTYGYSESDAFYKARCNAYIQTYVEDYWNEYGVHVTRTIGSSLTSLEDAFNSYFVKLINDSSDAIHEGRTKGYGVTEDGQIEYPTKTAAEGGTVIEDKNEGENASWLYIAPNIGNDTNTDEISTSVGGWWYLVEDNGKSVGYNAKSDDPNKITVALDSVAKDSIKTANKGVVNKEVTTEEAFTRADASEKEDDTNVKVITAENGRTSIGTGDENKTAKYSRLDAKLYEVKPNMGVDDHLYKNGTAEVYKTVSNAYPFINGSFPLPSKALTNIFANAKITFKIAFQAVQAFFPYTESIDDIDYQNVLVGKAKALSIRNAIPIFNEAFDFNVVANDTIEGL